MPSALRFPVPVQGDGIGGGVGQESGVEWSHVYAIAGDLNGYTKWSRQKLYTGFTHDTEYLMVLRNRGSGGKHLWIQKSTDASTILQVTDAGLSLAALTVSGQITSTVTTASGLAPFIVASTVKVVNLNADLLDDQSGSYYLSRTNHTGTQAPSTISPQGSGSGLDADTLDGHDTSFFATASALSGYLPLTGGTLSGLLTMELSSGNDQQIKLKHNAGAGGFFIGGSNAADPVLIFKDNSSDQTFEVGNSSSTYQARVLGAFNVSGTIAAAGGITLSGPSNIDGNGGTAGQIRIGAVIVNAANLDGSEELLVNGQSKLKGDVTITTGTFRHESGGNARIEANSTGAGFFGATPIARPTVTGTRTGTLAQLQAAFASLTSALDGSHLGLITDLTS